MFLEGMKIMLGDKTCVKVEEVVCGDILMTENFAQVKVIAVIDGQEDAVTYIKLQSGGNIVVSVDQKFLTAKGLVEAKDLAVGEKLISTDLAEKVIETIRIQDNKKNVYGFYLEGKNLLVNVNGFWLNSCID